MRLRNNNLTRAIAVTTAVALTALTGSAAYVAAQPGEQVIKVTAYRWDYNPNVIKLKKGVPVVLEFTTLDVLMGFKVPELNLRTDIVPGQVARLRIVPQKTGAFPFLCDIFCGAGHEEMTGSIVVSD